MFLAKKLPKNDQAAGPGGNTQGRRLLEGDQGTKAADKCCK